MEDPNWLRELLAAMDTKLDGKRAAANAVRLRRIALKGVIAYGIEKKALAVAPCPRSRPKKHVVDQCGRPSVGRQPGTRACAA
jgi:hypothetical protein